MSSFRQLQELAMLGRFNESQRQWVRDWINYEWVRLWSEYDWDFRDVGPTVLTVTGGEATPTVPTDLLNIRHLYDQNGSEIEGLSAVDFDRRYPPSTLAGVSGAFKLVNGTLTLGPPPSSDASYQIVYVRRAGSHPKGDTAVFRVGPLVDDADIPAFLLSEHHPLIAYRAARLGMKLTLDPSWRELDDFVREAEAAMLADVLPDHGGDRPLQYGGI